MKHILVQIFIIGYLLPATIAAGQEKYTLSGYVRDASSGEELIGATVFAKDLLSGTITNQYGFYSLTLPAGKHTIIYQYLGYESVSVETYFTKNIRKDTELKPASKEIKEVIVSGKAADYNVRSAEMGTEKLFTREIRALPVIFGEQDVLKTMQLLPGISAVGEGNSGLFVRGGDASQNLILLDEAPVFNASHLLGFFSVFNSDAIKDVKIMKGYIPAEYGERLSSVLDIKMKEGNSKKMSGSGGLGLISSRLQLEGPVNTGKGSFMLTGRRTYADMFLKILPDSNLHSNVLYFYDINAKANYRTGEKDRFFISGYLGRDVFKFRKLFGFDWGNKTLTFRWNHLFSDRIFLNSSLIYSDYDYKFNIMNNENEFYLRSSIKDINWKEDFQFFISSRNTIRFGFKSNYHQFMPGEVSSTGNFPVNNTKMETKYALENATYFSQESKLANFLTIKYGLRLSAFSLLGPAHIYSFDEQGKVTDTTKYSNRSIIKTYLNLEPRILLNFSTGTASSVKASYTRMHQYLHLLSNTTSSTPLDLWVPSSIIVRPQTANQFSIGYFRNFNENRYEASLEVYYKNMNHQIEYKNGADIFLNELVESQLVFGTGKAYGAEMMIKKNKGLLHGWISYTLSRSLRHFPDINNGHMFPAKQDRTHDVSLVAIYDLNDRWTFSATWVYYTGDAVTFPSGKYLIENQYINYYTERNGYRMPPYHRMDLGATLRSKKTKKWQSSWNFSIYNVYARKNAYSITFRSKEDNPRIIEAVKLYLFSIIPSVTYNFRF